ncbi:MAG TPA: ribosome recycling factor [Planctomycetota bacterium]|nr:ribosome recycling factor [Planctomycetota bacterium]
MDIEEILLDAEERMIKSVADYDSHLRGVRSGQASVEMVEHVHVDIPAYGGVVPLKSVAITTKADARMLTIKPFDPKTIKEIEKGINAANLGLTPMNDGKIIRLNFPPMSEENRKKVIKLIKDRLEQHKVTIRNVRHEALKALKENKGKLGVGEDAEKKAEEEVNDLTKKYEGQLEAHFEKKSKEIMTV